jgi:hypothetical protein
MNEKNNIEKKSEAPHPKNNEELLEILKNTKEIGGVTSEEPTKFGDWSLKGRVSDF